MKHTEQSYINAGFRYESATGAETARAHAEAIRRMLTDEHIKDHPEARRLIDQGRAEARQGGRK